ncbi:hypothetical protein [Pelagicoccus sp. SDUM812003]|uniref:hypothetical protein n=1 Tax=Pelagicoccus sp. SDUM812003 TaxID=3041267 RepID=UPI0028107977|nr:hypothetical protein [Pelagicoccus sp. SDUM812003]MDQ8204350.1 hypothetical protein [Pelagicoccus sp. SDUM812003]
MATEKTENLFCIQAPTGVETLGMLRKFLGYRAEALWLEACEACGVKAEASSVTELEQIAHFLSKQGSLAAVVGNGALIRIRVYRSTLAQ